MVRLTETLARFSLSLGVNWSNTGQRPVGQTAGANDAAGGPPARPSLSLANRGYTGLGSSFPSKLASRWSEPAPVRFSRSLARKPS